MASLTKDRRLLFNVDGKRKSLSLGAISSGQAQVIKSHIESIISSRECCVPLNGVAQAWVQGVSGILSDRLARCGLIDVKDRTTIGELFASFVDPTSKPGTLNAWRTLEADFGTMVGVDILIREFSEPEAIGFRSGLLSRGLSGVTVQKRLQMGRQLFGHAMKQGWVESNPFDGVTCKCGNPRERQQYISAETTNKLLEASPDWCWRTIIAMSRFGGLRCPSEVLSARLVDIDWDKGSMVVIAPKTSDTRTIPMFKRLRPHLEEAWEKAAIGQVNVIPEGRYLPSAQGPAGWSGCNLRSTLRRIVVRAGLTPWPRLFHNLRASCESDLARDYSISTACRWIGNTANVAVKHYIQVTDQDFEKAVGE